MWVMEKPKEHSRCLICRRKLKNPLYRRTGIGPRCKEKYGNKRSSIVIQIEMEF